MPEPLRVEACAGGVTRYLAFDLETTGLDPESDRIIEFCFTALDDELRELETHTALVNPGMPIPAESIAVHGITDEDVADAKPFVEYAARLQALVKDKILVAHNHRFDTQFLNAELRRAGRPGLAVDHPCIDTLTIERFVNSHRLEEAYTRYTGKSLEGAHRSEADVRATVEVLRGQREQFKDRLPESVAELVHENIEKIRNPDRPARTWLDHARRFYAQPGGDAYYAFGKYRDARVADHTDYLEWMIRSDFPEDTKGVAKRLLADLTGAGRPAGGLGSSARGSSSQSSLV